MDLSALGHRGERQSQIRMDHGEAAHYDAEAVFRTFNPAGPQDAATLKVRTPSLCHTDYSYDPRMDPVQVHTNGIGPGEHGIEKRRPLTHGGLLPPTLPQDALDQNYQATDSGMGYPWPAPLSVAFQCLVPSLPAQGGSGSSHDASSDGMSHSFAPSLLDGDHFNVGPYSSPANTFVDGLCAGYAWGPTSPQAMHDQAFQSLLDGHINSYPLAQSVPRMWIQAEGPLVVEPWTPYRLNPSPADLVLNFPDTGYEEDYEINSGQADMPAQQSTLNTDANHIYQLTSDTSPLCEEAGARSLQALSSQTSEVELVNMPIASRLSASSTLEAHQHVFDARTGSSVHSRSRKQATKAQKDDSHQIRHGGGACRVCKKGKRKVCSSTRIHPVFT